MKIKMNKDARAKREVLDHLLVLFSKESTPDELAWFLVTAGACAGWKASEISGASGVWGPRVLLRGPPGAPEFHN